jgi:hypothetical protein
MSINRTDWDKINATIKTQVETQLRKQPKDGDEHKASRWMKDWQVPAIVVGLVAVVLGVLLTQSYDRNGKQERFQGETTATLSQVKENIGTLQKDYSTLRDEITTLKIQVLAVQPIAQFRSHLPELRPSLAQATSQQSKIPPAIMSDLQSKLQTVGTDAPGYWPVVADFITYRSIAGSSWTIKNLPNCRDTKPKDASLNMNGLTSPLGVSLLEYDDCRFTFDSSVDGAWLNPLIVEGKVLFFARCVVEYHGGPLEIRLDLTQNRVVDSFHKGAHAMTMSVDRTITFTDCIFQLSVDQSPSEQAKQLTAFLLNQNTKTIALRTRKAG